MNACNLHYSSLFADEKVTISQILHHIPALNMPDVKDRFMSLVRKGTISVAFSFTDDVGSMSNWQDLFGDSRMRLSIVSSETSEKALKLWVIDCTFSITALFPPRIFWTFSLKYSAKLSHSSNKVNKAYSVVVEMISDCYFYAKTLFPLIMPKVSYSWKG